MVSPSSSSSHRASSILIECYTSECVTECIIRNQSRRIEHPIQASLHARRSTCRPRVKCSLDTPTSTTQSFASPPAWYTRSAHPVSGCPKIIPCGAAFQPAKDHSRTLSCPSLKGGLYFVYLSPMNCCCRPVLIPLSWLLPHRLCELTPHRKSR